MTATLNKIVATHARVSIPAWGAWYSLAELRLYNLVLTMTAKGFF